jgi:very-short-patch-repair endonuclease
MARHLDGTIAERSRKQLGLLHTDQALQLGTTPHQLRGLIEAGFLERVEPGVLRVAGAPVTWEQRLLAGLLGLGPDAVVSHAAAAALWGLDGVQPGAVEFTVPRTNRNRLSLGLVHSSLTLDPVDLTTRGRFPLTTAARTLIDLAQRFTTPQLEAAVDAACRDRLITETGLLARLDAVRRPGRSKLLAVLGADRASGRPHTWLEREALALFRRHGITGVRMQTELTPDGRLVRVDCMVEAAKLVVELAGHRTHSTRRQRQADNERRLRLEQQGYRVLEFTYEDVTQRPEYVVQTVLARLAVPH